MTNANRIAGSVVLVKASALGALLAVTSLAAGAVAAQQPRIANARVASQPAGSSLAQSFRTLVASQTEPAWIGYTVPVVDSQRIMCCFNGDSSWSSGGVVMSDSLVVLPRLPPRARGRRHVDDNAERGAGSVAAGRRAA